MRDKSGTDDNDEKKKNLIAQFSAKRFRLKV